MNLIEFLSREPLSLMLGLILLGASAAIHWRQVMRAAMTIAVTAAVVLLGSVAYLVIQSLR